MVGGARRVRLQNNAFSWKTQCESRIPTTSDTPPKSPLKEHVYRIDNVSFREQRVAEQSEDPIIRQAKTELQTTGNVTMGRLKRVSKQLKIEKEILTKSGRPVVPSNLHEYVMEKFHEHGDTKAHFGVEKTYAAIKLRFYWANMYRSVEKYVAACQTCQQCKAHAQPAKAPLVPLLVPEKPIDFLCIDIAYMEPDNDGYRYILLIGCVFAKFIAAVPLKDQTAEVIVEISKKMDFSPRFTLVLAIR